MKNVKIVIGANYGDEGKGMMTRHFTVDAKNKGDNSIIVFHNGTAQRGHTVDYNPEFRHVYHHFGSGTGDGATTYFAETFLVHPMEFRREWHELSAAGMMPPTALCDPKAKVITPFDMVVDRATEEWIAKQHGEREFGSCGYGSWCAAEDRIPMGKTAYTVEDFMHFDAIPYLMEQVWKDCRSILFARGVEIEKTSFAHVMRDRTAIIQNFTKDLKFFYWNVLTIPFDTLWENPYYNTFIFENGQGLGLDVDVDNDWHTTSHTGIYNPVTMLRDKDFKAEVCYVSRSYVTRHGVGPLEDEVKKSDINSHMIDITNVPNDFQGSLRYAGLDLPSQYDRIVTDYAKVLHDDRFTRSVALTHLNEAPTDMMTSATYISNNPYTVKENK